jgi:alkylation response protein AidB-like acyl-CoA dehydrogenase
MTIYHAPIRDMQFVLHELLNVEKAFAILPSQSDTNRELMDAVLQEMAKLCEEVLAPLNAVGDEHGCTYENGVVRTPPGFRDAWGQFVKGGWPSLACHSEYDGQGLPKTLNFFVDEMVASANMAFGLYAILTFGAYQAIHASASDELKRTFLPRLATGTWTGTMCMTEPQSGTDLGLVRTRAVARGDEIFSISGQKIFITGGEQDLSENIVHLVLARTPDAPAGVKGISMFLVPKYLVNGDGSLGARNGVSCASIEEKMGIHGASTCVLNFEEATGYLVGDLNKGMRAMFTMMNHERLVVGVQGLAQSELSYQNAVEYARERLQSRAPSGAQNTEQPADPIIVHPDVRRMLLTGKAYNEGARAFTAWLGIQIDYSEEHPHAAAKQEAEDLVALLTPVVKGFFSDIGSEVCNLGMQVLGGHGYIRESGMEQMVRDARIAQLYEGTNGVQALDLVGRKISMHGGRLTDTYFSRIQAFVDSHQVNTNLADFVEPLAGALQGISACTDWICEQSDQSVEEIGAVSTDYMRFMGLLSLAYMWAMMAERALAGGANGDASFYDTKLKTGRFFMRRLLPQVETLGATIRAGADTLMELDAAAF